jgi:MarR family transcriptional regulator, organic hydroperoxide resistance regulator
LKKKETVCSKIKSAWHGISRMYNGKAAVYDSSAAVGFVLLNIDKENGTPATKIGPMLGMESTSHTRMLKSMEERNLIYRQTDSKDKRKVIIYLTEEGKKKREISRAEVKNFNNKVKENVSESDLKTFFEVLNKISEITEINTKVFSNNHLNINKL